MCLLFCHPSFFYSVYGSGAVRVCPFRVTIDIDRQTPTIWNRLRKEPLFNLRTDPIMQFKREASLSTIIRLLTTHVVFSAECPCCNLSLCCEWQYFLMVRKKNSYANNRSEFTVAINLYNNVPLIYLFEVHSSFYLFKVHSSYNTCCDEDKVMCATFLESNR